MRVAFIVDPIEGFLVDKDTSFALMLEAQRRGHEVYTLGIQELWAEGGCVHGAVHRTTVQRPSEVPAAGRVAGAHFQRGPAEDVDLTDLDCTFMRKDPPFDAAYLHATQLLELARGRTLLVNDPRGLRDANEKLYALHFPSVMPPTLVTAEAARIKAFMRAQGGQAVIKPLDGAGGRGVFVLRADDKNVNALIETTTNEGKQAAMVQRFLPAVREGDRRILILDGEPLGGILRVPAEDEARSNIHVGGRVERHVLTARDREICATLAPRLRADGLVFVGIDVIGDHLTEVNVTSPTGIQELDRLDGQDATGRTIAWLEAHVARR